MSEHLWMYEGVTEYFANLFQINQGLITEEDFITAFQTKWSACNERHHVHYNECKRVETALQRSIHQRISKGSLIECVLILLLRKSKGEKGLDLMQNLLMNMVFQNHLMIMNFC
jgi:predicted metalloprotease with PDZ domain